MERTAGKREAEADGAAPQIPAPLRIGIFMHGPVQPWWWVHAMREVALCGFAQVVLLVSGAQRWSGLPWIWRAYAAAEAGLFRAGPDPARGVDAMAHIPHRISMQMPGKDTDAMVVAAWWTTVAGLGLDVVFVTAGVDGAFLETVATYGVWRFCFGGEAQVAESMAGIREVACAAPVCASGIRVRRGSAGGDRLVYRSWSRTIPVSLARTRSHLLRKTSHFACRALKPLHDARGDWLERWDSFPSLPPEGTQAVPGNREALQDITGIAGRVARRIAQKLAYVDQWFLAYRFSREGGWPGDLRDYRCLVPPKDRMWADPFPLERDGRHFVFFEELVFAEKKGHIAVVELGPDGPRGAPRRVLERPHHLSYPFLLEHEGELYMIPESGHAGNVVLYRCIEFPHRWRAEKVLLEGGLFTDASVHFHDGIWWMFATLGIDGGEAHDELHVYYAPRLLGDWKAHPRNPVCSDVRGARPAGRPYLQEGMLLRPAQICAPLYGSGVAIHRILRLSLDAYEETEHLRVVPLPASGVLGIHTVNRAGDLWLVDAFIRRNRAGLGRPMPFRPLRAPWPASSAPPGGIR